MCASAECFASACSKDYLDCDHDLSAGESGTGCEVDSQSDDQNCGSWRLRLRARSRLRRRGVCLRRPGSGRPLRSAPRIAAADLGTNCSIQGDSWSVHPARLRHRVERLHHRPGVRGRLRLRGRCSCYLRCNKQQIEYATAAAPTGPASRSSTRTETTSTGTRSAQNPVTRRRTTPLRPGRSAAPTISSAWSPTARPWRPAGHGLRRARLELLAATRIAARATAASTGCANPTA